jgi:hypothetical protein
MTTKLKDVLERATGWPEADQAELADRAEEIEGRHRGGYQASPDELAAIDEADRSGVAGEHEVAAAFAAFRSA